MIYVLEDSIEILDDCPCGSVFKTIRVHGRSDDIFNLIDTDGQIKRILPVSLESSVFLNAPLISYQVIHVRQNFLLIRYVTDNKDCQNILRDQMDKYLNKRKLNTVQYKLEKHSEIKRRGGKIRQIISLV